VAGYGGDIWGADGGGIVAVNAPQPVINALSYGPGNTNGTIAGQAANQSVSNGVNGRASILSQAATCQLNLGSSEANVPSGPNMG
jgi:hypothetical protein